MAGLKPFRFIPTNIREWTRWMRDQDIPTVDAESVAAVQTQYPADTMILSGIGTPEAFVLASVGYLYLRTDGGTNTTLYVKESGTNTKTGWVAM